jgi:hypothetical protein
MQPFFLSGNPKAAISIDGEQRELYIISEEVLQYNNPLFAHLSLSITC